MHTKRYGTQISSCYTQHDTLEGSFEHLAAIPSKILDAVMGWISNDGKYIYFYVQVILFRLETKIHENGILHLIQVPEKSVNGYWIT